MTLRTRVSLLLGIIISLTLAIVGWLYIDYLEVSLRESIFKGLASVNETSSQAISRFMLDTSKEAGAVAQALSKKALAQKQRKPVEDTLKSYFDIFPKFENGMFVLDAAGTLWADYPSHPSVRGRSFAHRQYFKKTMAEKRGIIGVPYFSARTGKPVLTFTEILKDAAGGIIGMVGCSVPLTSPRALEGIRLTKIGHSGYIYVYNKDRLMILHPKQERILKRDVHLGANRLFDAAIDGFEGTGETVNSRGIPLLAAIKRVPGTDWIIGAQQPKSEAYAPIYDARRKIIYVIILAALFSSVLGALLMKRIVKPLVQLQLASRLLGEIGETPGAPFPDKQTFNRQLAAIQEGGEIGNLKRAFVQMSGKMDQTMGSLKKLADDWENTFNSVKDAIFLLDRRSRIIRLNAAAKELAAASAAVAIGADIAAFLDVPAGDLQFDPEPDTDPKDTSEVIEINTRQGLRRFEFNRTPLIDDQQEAATILVGKDITLRLEAEKEKRDLEIKLQKAQKMEAIGTLAGGVAHDLNNILSAIISYPELILLDLPDDSPLVKPIETILQSGKKASAIVQDLLTLARRGVDTFEVLNLNRIIEDYLKSPEFKKLSMHHPHLEQSTHLSGDLLNIKGSAVHLSKTIMNLVANSAEAMPAGGTIRISTENRYIDTPVKGYDHIAEGDYVVVSISDEGLGISDENLERIFEPFYTKKRMGHSGTGLGMSVVWGTVKDHEGYIDLESQVGFGTTFNLYFPVTRDELENERKIVGLSELSGNGESILVVDDIDKQRVLASSILEKLGYSVRAVESGMAAVEFLKTERVDLLVLDMIMEPGIDGLETYRRACEINPGQRAIITSGFSENDRVKSAQALGAGQYVKKPYTIEKFGLAIKQALSG